VLEVADIIRRHATALRAALGARLLPSQARALRDLVACRTAACGGQLTQCTACGRHVYRYHSCRNRHCPKCGGDQTVRWLERHRPRLLPCPHYLITVTLPRELRAVAFAHQATVYGALMRSAARAVLRLAADPRYVGVSVGCIAVLHTWTRALLYNPHVHLIVTAGGLSADRTQWIAPKHPAFLVPVQALSVIVRAKMCAALNRASLLDRIPTAVWTTPWVIDARPAGNRQRVLDYLARYLFRVAISNSRLEHLDDQVERNKRHQDRHVDACAPIVHSVSDLRDGHAVMGGQCLEQLRHARVAHRLVRLATNKGTRSTPAVNVRVPNRRILPQQCLGGQMQHLTPILRIEPRGAVGGSPLTRSSGSNVAARRQPESQ
jgi:predicted RNA-binding Zn-ribbon protein involved in translation (DUF1610 family)